MTDSGPRNILFLVWDSCRKNHIEPYARNFRQVGSNNVLFENAIAPSPWSLPSHASIFTGELPHQHGIYSVTDSMEEVTLLDELSDRGYRRFGISGNGFVSNKTNFHEHFERFQYTSGQGPYLDGLTIYAHVFGQKGHNESMSPVRAGLDTAKAVVTHDNLVKSAINFAAVGLNRISAHAPPLQRIPHPAFNPYQPFSYTPERNTRMIEDILRDQADSDNPFFIFANYMDPHRPYTPPPEYQEAELGETLSYRELVRISEGLSNPWEFAERAKNGEVDEEELKTLRALYAGEVRSVDEYLPRLLSELDELGLREDTLVVVTADHGENLGEVDEMGRRRMGHESSISNALLRVPLMIANPELEDRVVEDHVSLRRLFDLFIEGQEPFLESRGRDTSMLESSSGIVTSQYPAVGGEEIHQRHPNAPEEFIRQRVEDNAVVGYTDAWRIVIHSTDGELAWHDGNRVEIADVPSELVERCRKEFRHLENDDEAHELTDEEISQLKSLGYI